MENGASTPTRSISTAVANESHLKFLSKKNVAWIAGPTDAKSSETKDNGENFIESLWMQCIEEGFPQRVLQSPFWQGMKSNRLDATFFGKLNIQDIAFCFHTAHTFEKGLKKALDESETELADYLHQRSLEFSEYVEELKQIWGIKPNGMTLLESTKVYVDFQDSTLDTLTPYYLCVVNYACYKLWLWLSNQIINEMDPKCNCYYPWVYDKTQEETLTMQVAKRINQFFANGKLVKSMTYRVLANSLTCEANMFLQATNENKKLHPLPFDIANSNGLRSCL